MPTDPYNDKLLTIRQKTDFVLTAVTRGDKTMTSALFTYQVTSVGVYWKLCVPTASRVVVRTSVN